MTRATHLSVASRASAPMEGSSNPIADVLPYDLADIPFGFVVLGLFLGVMVRANATYWIGRAVIAGGRRSRLRGYVQGPAMARAERFMARWGMLAVPLCFLTVGVQTAVNLSAGATRMPLRRYLPAVAVGSAAWAVLYATVGLAAVGVALLTLAESPPVLLLLLVGLVAGVWWRVRRRRSRVSEIR